MIARNKDSSITKYILNFVDKHYKFFLGLILLLSIFNLFYCLGDTPIYSWDEARHGISAYEMLKRRDFIVNTYGYRNDYWNLKPPMSFWAIILGYKIGGFNAFGLRLVSALAALATIIAVALLTKYKHGAAASLIAALVLSISPKYIMIHSARTGDADVLFVFFFTSSIIALILSSQNINWLYLSGVLFSLAFLTKSWHAANIMLIIFAYLFISGDLFRLKLREFLIFSLCSSLLIILWSLFRYSKDGLTFISNMIYYDLLSRSATPLEGHTGNRLYYFKVLSSYYKNWIKLLFGSIVVYIIVYREKFIKREFKANEKKYVLVMLLWILVPLTMFTMAKTKIGWYILPLYPPISVCIGAACGELIRGNKRNFIISILILIVIFRSSVYYEKVIYKHIIQFKNEADRVTFQKFKVNKDIKGRRVYMEYDGANINYGPKSEFKDWKQSDLLSVELYWDLIPMEGGLRGFLRDKDNDAVIIMKKGNAASDVIRRYNLKVLGESNLVFMLEK